MTQSDERATEPSVQDVALIVGGGPGISASCARLFAESGMRVGIAARNPDKSVLTNLEKTHGVRRYECDASEPAAVELLFQKVVRDLGVPTLVVHNIDGRVAGIFRKGIIEADPTLALDTLRHSAFSAFLVGQQAALLMRENKLDANGKKGTIIFTNASAALKGQRGNGTNLPQPGPGSPDLEAKEHSEGIVAKTIEKQTAKLPSGTFLLAAGASIVASLALQMMGRKTKSTFVAQWAPTILILGLYNKIVKVAGSDRTTT